MPTPADLFVSPDLTEARARAYLESLGFRDPVAADDHLQRMADDLVVRESLGRLASDLIPSLLESPDPDAALAGVSHYIAARTGRAMFLDYLREDPRALHVLTYVLGASPPLGEILIRTPEYFHWLVSQVERSAPDRRDHEEELVSVFSSIDDPVEALDILRRWKRREVLRIGTRELLRRETVQTVATQLSDIACVAIDFALAIVMRQTLESDGRDTVPGSFAVIGTGQLGAQEISYTSHLSLQYVFDTTGVAEVSNAEAFFTTVGLRLADALSEETRVGQLYHVAPATWPGVDGRLQARSLEDYAAHLSASEDSGACGQLTRARAVAGDADLGSRFIEMIQSVVFVPTSAPDGAAVGKPDARGASASAAGATADKTAGKPIAPVAADPPYADIDRLTRTFQVGHGSAHPALRDAGTLAALDTMCKVGLIDEAARRELDHAYVFLRSAYHRRELGVPEDLQSQLDASRDRVREICEALVQRR